MDPTDYPKFSLSLNLIHVCKASLHTDPTDRNYTICSICGLWVHMLQPEYEAFIRQYDADNMHSAANGCRRLPNNHQGPGAGPLMIVKQDLSEAVCC